MTENKNSRRANNSPNQPPKSFSSRHMKIATASAAGLLAASAGGVLASRANNEPGTNDGKPTAEQIAQVQQHLNSLPFKFKKNFGDQSIAVDPKDPNLTDVTFQPTEEHPYVSNLTEMVAPDQLQEDAYTAVESYNDGSEILHGPVTVRVDNRTGFIVSAPKDSPDGASTTG